MNMKVSTLTVATVAVASLFPSITEADTQTTAVQPKSNAEIGYVKLDNVQLYQERTTNSDSLGNISYNTPVIILETTRNWYKVNAQNKIGYIQKSNLSLKKLNQERNQYIVNASALNLRSEPNIQSAILDVLPNGTFISVQETHSDWYLISHNGKTGYVKKEFVSNSLQPFVKGITIQNNSYYVATPRLRVRSGAGTNTAVIGSLQNGAQIQVVGKVGSWYKIRFGSGYGYVAQQYVLQNKQQEKSVSPSIPAVFKFPTQGQVSSNFEVRWGQMHYGVDFTATGDMPIRAAATGKVIKSYYSSSYGNVVFVTHYIKGKLYTTVYAHMKNRSVQVGDRVQAGQLLGQMGNTGHSTGQHLHFELHNGEWNFEKTNAVDPLPYLVR
ncbi:SH3 domain-containing protein [Bacillus sp. Xin]|uniref:SH3 domain-containing protein n=1 Tax=unclassified Bacillus (in: firmicutes) TaxID=185979 RepID=UPI001571ABB6|nr:MULTISPECIES: SH3 domain-containing protein [unclassified Bacillus (in: firmicutes)]MBC6972151.1 SH3 domain-containing protein [Bacillus sp. Xin]NSW36917.1 SH3 domain-containing protein [Bacillus sp. Xin1]